MANDHKRVTFDTGLKKGEYRLYPMLQQVRFIRLHFRISQSATNIRQRKQKHKQLKRKNSTEYLYNIRESSPLV
ncbi:MAG: hypothetical protein ACLS54_13175 [Anaerostipes hadrus]